MGADCGGEMKSHISGIFAAFAVLLASWAIADGVAAVSGDDSPTWQTLAVSALTLISGWLQYQARKLHTSATNTLDHIERSIDRLMEQVRVHGERIARIEGMTGRRFIDEQ